MAVTQAERQPDESGNTRRAEANPPAQCHHRHRPRSNTAQSGALRVDLHIAGPPEFPQPEACFQAPCRRNSIEGQTDGALPSEALSREALCCRRPPPPPSPRPPVQKLTASIAKTADRSKRRGHGGQGGEESESKEKKTGHRCKPLFSLTCWGALLLAL